MVAPPVWIFAVVPAAEVALSAGYTLVGTYCERRLLLSEITFITLSSCSSSIPVIKVVFPAERKPPVEAIFVE